MWGSREKESWKTPNNKVGGSDALPEMGTREEEHVLCVTMSEVGVKVKVLSGAGGSWIHWWSQIAQENIEEGDAKTELQGHISKARK